MKKIFLPIIALLSAVMAMSQSPLQLDRLTCENLINPLGIDEKQPRFGWSMTSAQQNQFQSAYEILVSDNSSKLEKLQGTVWSSGKVINNQQLQIPYQGKELLPQTRYFWRVRVYDQDNKVSGWSKINWFETGMQGTENWTAKWISDGRQQPARDEDYYKDDPMPLFRKEFG